MPKNDETREKANWQGYVNWNPGPTEREAIKASLLSNGQFEGLLLDLVDEGYKVSFYHDGYRNSLVMGVYGYYADCKNPGKMLVIPHADPRVAASALAFFRDNVAEHGVWPDQVRLDNPYDW